MSISATDFGECVFSIFVLLFAMLALSSIVGGITTFMTQLWCSLNDGKKGIVALALVFATKQCETLSYCLDNDIPYSS